MIDENKQRMYVKNSTIFSYFYFLEALLLFLLIKIKKLSFLNLPDLITLFFFSFLYSIIQESSVRHHEREKNVLVGELTSQNARLTTQLESANQLEIQLNNRLHELRSQYSLQNNTLQVRFDVWNSLGAKVRNFSLKNHPCAPRM